ncbi:unnamed protein product, partial [Coccothraustes coccothraustes]
RSWEGSALSIPSPHLFDYADTGPSAAGASSGQGWQAGAGVKPGAGREGRLRRPHAAPRGAAPAAPAAACPGSGAAGARATGCGAGAGPARC